MIGSSPGTLQYIECSWDPDPQCKQY